MRKTWTHFFLVLILILVFSVGAVSSAYSEDKSQKYGILGQVAPEFKSVEWVDKDGKQIDPIQVSDYSGKVIYLLFFQDW